MPLLGPYVLSVVMCDWDMVTRVYSIQCFVGSDFGHQCRGAVSCLWACVAMYAWDVVTGMFSIRSCGGGHDVCRC
mgnify:CR=1 FL=1